MLATTLEELCDETKRTKRGNLRGPRYSSGMRNPELVLLSPGESRFGDFLMPRGRGGARPSKVRSWRMFGQKLGGPRESNRGPEAYAGYFLEVLVVGD